MNTFTASEINELRRHFAEIKAPVQPAHATKISKVLRRCSTDQLAQLADAGIPFVSFRANDTINQRRGSI
jgi:hypothetical protein